MIGVHWRRVPNLLSTQPMWTSTHPPFRLPSNTKPFRRELIERHGLRYPEDLPIGSDQPFTLEACLRARRVSVLADYDYYFAVRREDAGNITYRRRPEILIQCTA